MSERNVSELEDHGQILLLELAMDVLKQLGDVIKHSLVEVLP